MKCKHCWSDKFISSKGGYLLFGLDENDDLSINYSEKAYVSKFILGDEEIVGEYVRIVRHVCLSCGTIDTKVHEEDLEYLNEMDSIVCRYNDLPENKEDSYDFEEDIYY
jgi:hypothetical protein